MITYRIWKYPEIKQMHFEWTPVCIGANQQFINYDLRICIAVYKAKCFNWTPILFIFI